MTDDPLDAMIHAGTVLLGIPLDPAWHDQVRAHLGVCLRHGMSVADFPLDDAAEPAPVFVA